MLNLGGILVLMLMRASILFGEVGVVAVGVVVVAVGVVVVAVGVVVVAEVGVMFFAYCFCKNAGSRGEQLTIQLLWQLPDC